MLAKNGLPDHLEIWGMDLESSPYEGLDGPLVVVPGVVPVGPLQLLIKLLVAKTTLTS